MVVVLLLLLSILLLCRSLVVLLLLKLLRERVSSWIAMLSSGCRIIKTTLLFLHDQIEAWTNQSSRYPKVPT